MKWKHLTLPHTLLPVTAAEPTTKLCQIHWKPKKNNISFSEEVLWLRIVRSHEKEVEKVEHGDGVWLAVMGPQLTWPHSDPLWGIIVPHPYKAPAGPGSCPYSAVNLLGYKAVGLRVWSEWFHFFFLVDLWNWTSLVCTDINTVSVLTRCWFGTWILIYHLYFWIYFVFLLLFFLYYQPFSIIYSFIFGILSIVLFLYLKTSVSVISCKNKEFDYVMLLDATHQLCDFQGHFSVFIKLHIIVSIFPSIMPLMRQNMPWGIWVTEHFLMASQCQRQEYYHLDSYK